MRRESPDRNFGAKPDFLNYEGYLIGLFSELREGRYLVVATVTSIELSDFGGQPISGTEKSSDTKYGMFKVIGATSNSTLTDPDSPIGVGSLLDD